MSKVFMSFLGTSEYKPVTYYFKERKLQNVKYVQEAILKLICTDFAENDRVIVFLTEAAKEKNWEKIDTDKIGLKKTLEEAKKELRINFQIESVAIPEGKTEKEIWEIFGIVFNKLRDGDELILDVTHAFRSIPILSVVLLNYARFLKNILVKGIFYGAYEARNKSNEAPIFDLTSFDTLLRWSNAADSFLNYGITGPIERLLKDRSVALRKGGETENANKLNYFGQVLGKITKDFLTVRGREILNGKKFEVESQNIDSIDEEFMETPFRGIKDKIQEKLQPFGSKNSIKNCVAAVSWYIDHGLIQQGITLTQELIITFILKYLNFPWDDLKLRNLVSYCIKLYTQKIPESEWGYDATQQIETVRMILSSKPLKDLARLFDKLRDYRNDINHGGFLKDAVDAHKFKTRLEEIYPKIKDIILSYHLD